MKYVVLLISTTVVWIGAATWLVLAPKDGRNPAALPVLDVAPLEPKTRPTDRAAR